jgi:hypothetical protein
MLSPALALAAVLAVAIWWVAARGGGTPEERILRRFLARIEKVYGIPRNHRSRGLKELADLVNDPAAAKFAAIFGGIVYRDRRLSSEEFRQLMQVIDAVGKGGRQEVDRSP